MPRHPRSRPFASTLLAVLAVVVLGIGIGVIPTHPSRATPLAAAVPAAAATRPVRPAATARPTMLDAAATTPAARTTSPASGWTPPATSLISNDPRYAPHRIADTLARYIGAVPTGATIKVETYFIESAITVRALKAAYRRGVHVQIIVSGAHHRRYPDETALAKLLGTDRAEDSWLHWAHGASRGGVGSKIDHDKVWRFSQVGKRHWVTVVSSYNNSAESDKETYALALSAASRPIYRHFERLWTQSRSDRPVAEPTRTARGTGWEAYWLPGTRLAPSADPAVRRLREIPARPGTVLHVQMYSMFGVRGAYVASQLVSMARRGAKITFVAGPTVDVRVQRRLRAAGVDVQAGCWRDGTYDHGKDMDATWVSHGKRVYETWVGSDNWNDDNYLHADQAELGLTGPSLYRSFDRAFARVVARSDAALGHCPSGE